MSVAQAPLAALDFETTGTDPATARPVQASLLVVAADGTLVYERSTLIDPGVEVPAEAAAVHGITTERARGGIPVDRAIAGLAAELAPGGAAHGHPLVICNVPYDWPLLLCELGRHAFELPPEPTFLDPLLLDRVVDKYRKGSRKLADMAAHYGVTFDGDAHGARADALAAVRVTRRIFAQYADLNTLTAADLQRRQRGWYADWKAGINAYWKRRGEAKEVTNGWPT